jgi:type I restriction enzyme R subunit
LKYWQNHAPNKAEIIRIRKQMSNKKGLSERDLCTQFILPALVKSGWDVEKQVREEIFFADDRIFVKGNKTAPKG